MPTLALGLRGPQGPPGSGGGGGGGTADSFFAFDQLTPASTWVVNHGLGKFPAVSVIDSGGSAVVGDVSYTDSNSLVIHFTSAFGGRAFCN